MAGNIPAAALARARRWRAWSSPSTTGTRPSRLPAWSSTRDRYPQWTGNLFVGALAQQHLARLVLKDGKVVEEERLFDGMARIRDVRQGPDGFLHIVTDEPAPDGRVLKLVM